MSARAQVTSGDALLQLTLTDVMAIVVQPVVPLGITSIQEYEGGLNDDVATQLTVSSNRPYDIKVKALGDLTAAIGGATIPIGKLTVTPMAGTQGATSAVALTTADQTIIDNAPGAILKVVGINYKSNDPSAFIQSGLYTATLTYSISAN